MLDFGFLSVCVCEAADTSLIITDMLLMFATHIYMVPIKFKWNSRAQTQVYIISASSLI